MTIEYKTGLALITNVTMEYKTGLALITNVTIQGHPTIIFGKYVFGR